MQTIIVQSPTVVLVDGQNYGKVADTIANNQQLASDIQIALELWAKEKEDAVEKATADAVDNAVLGVQAKLDQLVQAAESAYASGDMLAIAGVIEAAKTYTSAARGSEKAKKRAELQAQIDALA